MESPVTVAAAYLADHRSIDIGRCISRGIDLVTNNIGLIVGGSAVACVVVFGLAFVPIVGWIAGLAIDPVIAAGLFMVCVRRLRGEQPAVGDVFALFNTHFMNLFVAGLLCLVLVSIGLMLLVVPGVYLIVCYQFALPLVADKNLEPWTAMEVSRRVVHAQWFPMFALVVVAGIIACLGVLAVGVGVILTAPVAIASMAVAYEELFGTRGGTTTPLTTTAVP